MKKGLVLIGFVLFLASCGGAGKKEASASAMPKDSVATTAAVADSATYQCPMKCEGEKTYTKEGKCPKCEMALKEVKK